MWDSGAQGIDVAIKKVKVQRVEREQSGEWVYERRSFRGSIRKRKKTILIISLCDSVLAIIILKLNHLWILLKKSSQFTI